MVLPIVVATGARVAGTAAARSAASSGASAAARAASSGVRSSVPVSGNRIAGMRAASSDVSATSTRQAPSPIRSARDIRERAQAAGFEYEDSTENQEGITRLKRSVQQGQATEKREIKYRISLPVGFLLVALAVVLDVVEIILSLLSVGIGGFIKDVASWLFIAIFWMLNAPFWKGNKWIAKMTTMTATFVVGLIPVLSDFLPELTIGILATIIYTRIEDRLGSQIRAVKEINDKIVRFKRERGANQYDKAA